MDKKHERLVTLNKYEDYAENVEDHDHKQASPLRFTDKKRKEKEVEESTVGGF